MHQFLWLLLTEVAALLREGRHYAVWEAEGQGLPLPGGREREKADPEVGDSCGLAEEKLSGPEPRLSSRGCGSLHRPSCTRPYVPDVILIVGFGT